MRGRQRAMALLGMFAIFATLVLFVMFVLPAGGGNASDGTAGAAVTRGAGAGAETGADAGAERAAADGHEHSERSEHSGHSEHPETSEDDAHTVVRRSLDFSAEALERFGVRFVPAGPGLLDLGFDAPGEIRPDPGQVAAVGARFPGVVISVARGVGDPVKRGDVLAIVESDRLASFEIRSGLTGTVLEQRAAPGESIGPDRPGFVVGNLAEVWAVLAIYPRDAERVRVGQAVRIAAPGIPEIEGTIDYLSPRVDPHTRAGSARVVLDNTEGRWRPGLFVMGTILDPVEVAMRVPNDAVQTIDGRSVVFVRSGEEVEVRSVGLGRIGRTQTEVVAGLEPGESVAHVGTFLLKAEAEKGEAGGHHH